LELTAFSRPIAAFREEVWVWVDRRGKRRERKRKKEKHGLFPLQCGLPE